ncbi:MAG: alpha/beta hydrolase [Alphaproteobacteria bacterium]|nr:alpha/beta hydrolase [Alphaproteobacteria bacterium]
MTPAIRHVPVLGPSGFTDVATCEWGPRTGPAVLCLHGLTRNARDFDVLAQALAREGHRVVAVDMPGRGRSAWLANPFEYGYPLYLAAAASVIARLDVERLAVVGTSMGGLIGMMLAAQTGTPVARLVVNDVGPFIPKAALERIMAYIGLDPRFPTLARLEAALRQVHAPFGRLSDAQWQHLAIHGAAPVAGGWRLHYDPAIAKPLAAQPPADVVLWPVWDRIACPTLVLRGSESDLLLPETAREMTARGAAAAAGQVRVVEIAGCGHAPALMADDQVALLRGFLAG